jgi:MarR family transcriptional regulator, organic hydroperoxide resistance regulator
VSQHSLKELHENRRRAIKLMKRILTHFRTAMDEELRPCGVTIAQLQILWAIRNAPGSSGAQLSRQCEVTPQTAQELIQRAEENGWILRAKDSINDRIITASLTAGGEELLSTAEQAVRQIETKLWKGVSSDSLGSIIEVLEKCLDNVQ